MRNIVKRSSAFGPGTLTYGFGSDPFALFDGYFGSAVPSLTKNKTIKTRETDTGYEIAVSAPGLGREDFDVKVIDGTVSVSYDKIPEGELSFTTGTFNKAWTLPIGTEASDVTASSSRGVLTIFIAKPPTASPVETRIEVG